MQATPCSAWADRLEFVGDDDRLVASVGVLPIRLLAEKLGLQAALSAAWARPGFTPVYDRGQLAVDLGLALLLGGEAISDFQGLRHLAPVTGPVASTPTVWRFLDEADEETLDGLHRAVAAFRRHWWSLLAARPEGFPWLRVAGRELTGITVMDLDASIVFARSENKEKAAATYKGGVGFCPNLATCDNTDDVLVIDPRPGNATSNDAADNIATLTRAVERIPGAYRHRMLVRLDGAGFSHDLLEHIASGGGKRGRRWEFSVGWSCTDVETAAIAKLPQKAWAQAIEQDGTPVEDAFVAELTGLLDLSAWTKKIPGLRIPVRDEPLHPKYLKRASAREKELGRRYQLIAVNAKAGQLAWIDARHRSHVHVENDVKQGKAIGLNRWPSRHWDINVAWTQIVPLAGNLLAAYRWLALAPGEQRDASVKLLRLRLFDLPARLTRGQRRRWLHLRADWPWIDAVTGSWTRVKALPTAT
ncbi:IS1380 family transposase [Pseudofrankia sp. DC12]|uniref:IS1380 family transposase n=1 Tax=Pseudofrankia sp. DC12 TaxID=683315 RepID=UPI0005F82427|nr:IS1380 family transposase [Pseudofrankia sp. DC12]